MLTLPPSVRVFLAVEPVDMRGSFDALAGRVRALGLEPSDGHLYLFLSRRGHLAKCLYFDRSGWVVWQKLWRPEILAGFVRKRWRLWERDTVAAAGQSARAIGELGRGFTAGVSVRVGGRALALR